MIYHMFHLYERKFFGRILFFNIILMDSDRSTDEIMIFETMINRFHYYLLAVVERELITTNVS